MLQSNKLTSESGLTSQRPTSRIDISSLTKAPPANQSAQNDRNKQILIKIKQPKDETPFENPYFNIEKQRKASSMHVRPSFNRKTSSDAKNQIDYEEIKQYIQEVDHNYKDEIPFSRFQKPLRVEYSQHDKRITHLNMIVQSYREKIKSRNISNDVDQQQKFRNKIKIRSQQFAIIKEKTNELMGQQVRELKLDSERSSQICQHFQKSFRAQSDYIIKQIPQFSSQQISQLTEDLGCLDNYNLTTERKNSSRAKIKCVMAGKKILYRNLKCPSYIDTQIPLDESVISETEAKLNSLYGQSIQLQKSVMQGQQVNPVKIINSIKKLDQIKEMIDKVNQQKLMNKFII